MRQHQKVRQASLQIFAIILSILLIGQIAFAQMKNTSPDRGFSPGKSYSISDIENIAMQSGNLMLNLPLGSLPAGRGGMSGAINISYNSKLWDMDTFNDLNQSGVESPRKTLKVSEEGSWRYGYKYYFRVDYGGGDCSTGQGNFNKIQLVTPDGGTHTLIPSDGTSATSDADDYTIIFPDGRSVCAAATAVTGGQTIKLFSTDNSFLRMEITTDTDLDFTNNQWTLYAADGTRVVNRPQSGINQRIYDRNDNYIDIIETAVDSSYSNHQTTYLKDQLERKVVIEYNTSTTVDEDQIHSSGFEGEDVTTKVQWKSITVNKQYKSGDFSAPSPNPPNHYREFPINQTLRVVDKIYLPSQISGSLHYEFTYNADNTSATDVGWGEINRVTLPSGAYSDYEYEYDNVSGSSIETEKVLQNGVTEKTLTYDLQYDGSTTSTSDVWTYQRTGTTLIASSQMTAPDGGTTSEYYSIDVANYPGELYKTVGADGTVIEKLYQSNAPGISSGSGYSNSLSKANRYVKYEFVSITNNAGTLTQTTIKEYTRDKNGNTTKVKEYDFAPYSSVPRDGNGRPTGLPSGASTYLKRISVSDYYNQTPEASQASYSDQNIYCFTTAPRIRNVVKSAEIQDASGTPKSRTEMTYDNYSTTGNLTATKVWDSYKGNSAQSYSNPLTSTNSISTSASYNSYGMPTLTTDAMGVQTAITYGCIDGSTSCTSSPWLANLYPTKTEVASNYSSLKRTSTNKYDFYTGLATLATDVDNGVSTETYYDDLGRPTKVASAVGTSAEFWSQTEYDDVNRIVIVKADLETKGDAKKVVTQFFDELGRIRLTKTLEDASTQNATNETDGIKVQTRYMTTNSGGTGYSYQLTSNPYRATTSSGASSELAMGWTRLKTINTGKHSEVETFAGATLPSPFLSSGYNTNSTGVVTTDIDADRTLVTDQAGKQRISKTSALGWLTDVWEVTASDSATESISFPNQTFSAGYKTSYIYDPTNNLTTVTQGSQTRNFSYSSLSRLLSAQNPESGTISYQYDANGNLTRKTDARSIQANYTYDALNRVTERSYANEPSGQTPTPTVTYTYDNLTHAKGKLTKVTTGSVSSPFSITEYTEFDLLGRITKSKQTTDGTAYNEMLYSYNLSGALIEETYPSGRKVKNVLDTEGKLLIVQSKKNSSSGYWNYADSFTYTAAGAVTSMQLGNGHWESATFNSRLQPTQIGLGITQSATNLLKLDYSYGTTQNNGNVLSQTITAPTVGSYAGFTAAQTYNYDSLNRIKDATENLTPNGGSSVQTWKQTFTYDRYGNRSFNEGSSGGNYLTTTLTRGCSTSTYNSNGICNKKSANPTFASSNRINQNQDGTNDYTFDSAGNTTKSSDGNTFIYDGENKQIEVINSSSVTIGQYWYDGSGKRVKKYVPSTGETTIFVYDASGKMVAEYSNNLSQTPQVSYLTNDFLGSPRITTDKDGSVSSRRDFMPFGEEITSQETSQRTAALGYSNDSVRKKFTGYERDEETDIDFAQARYYTKKLGRFLSVDPIKMSEAHKTTPQRWNLYAYAVNCPTRIVDPDGKKPKKIIDIFVVITDEGLKDSNFQKNLDDLKKLGKDKNIQVNIYTMSDKTATLKQLNNSLTSKDRTVVILGHSSMTSQDTERLNKGEKIVGAGVTFYDGQLWGTTLKPDSQTERPTYIDKIKSSEVIILTCNNGAVNQTFAEKMNGELITLDNGDDGLTSTLGSANAAYAATVTLINGGDMKAASEAAQTEMNGVKTATEGRKLHAGDKIMQGDSVLYQDLRK